MHENIDKVLLFAWLLIGLAIIILFLGCTTIEFVTYYPDGAVQGEGKYQRVLSKQNIEAEKTTSTLTVRVNTDNDAVMELARELAKLKAGGM